MTTERRRFLHCLGVAGVGAGTGCLRLSSEQSQSAPATTSAPAFSVTVVGRQFSWAFSYPAFGLSGRQELVLPVGTTVEIGTESEDVFHAFGVEALDLKVDVSPAERTTTTVTPEQTGEYTAVCSELCGDGHADMTASVRVVSEPEFEDWRS